MVDRPYRIRTCDTLIKSQVAYIVSRCIYKLLYHVIHSRRSFLPGGESNVLSGGDTRLNIKGGGSHEYAGGGW